MDASYHGDTQRIHIDKKSSPERGAEQCKATQTALGYVVHDSLRVCLAQSVQSVPDSQVGIGIKQPSPETLNSMKVAKPQCPPVLILGIVAHAAHEREFGQERFTQAWVAAKPRHAHRLTGLRISPDWAVIKGIPVLKGNRSLWRKIAFRPN